MGPSGRITHVIGYIALFGTGICRFCIWVELPVQMRLCPIFVRNFGSLDIHECFRGLTSSQRTFGFGASHCMGPHCSFEHHDFISYCAAFRRERISATKIERR